MAKYNFYAVAIGQDPQTKERVTNKICDTWKECEAYVKNVEGARYKGFLTVPEAQVWITKVLEENELKNHEVPDEILEKNIKPDTPDNSKPSIASITRTKSYFEEVCQQLKLNPAYVNGILQNIFCKVYDMIKDASDDEVPFK